MFITLVIVRLAPIHPVTHVQHGDTVARTGVMRAVTNMWTVFIGMVTLEAPVKVFTKRCYGENSALTTDDLTVIKFLIVIIITILIITFPTLITIAGNI